MSVEQQVKDLNYKRMKAWDAAKAILDRAGAEGRELTVAEQSGYDRAHTEIRKIDTKREEILSSDAAKEELELINSEIRRISTPDHYADARSAESRAVAEFMNGRSGVLNIDLRRASYASAAIREGARGHDFAQRAGIFGDTGASGGSLVIPSLVSSQVYAVMQANNVMRQTSMSILTTPTGAPTAIPVGSQGAATQVANQDATIAGSDPTMASKVLRAYEAGQLVAIGNDLILDSGIDMLAWVSQTIAVSVAKLEEQWLVTGTGSGQPQGLMTAAPTGSAGTVATGGSLLLGPAGQVIEKLIDVQYAVNSAYRNVGEWLVNDSTAATMRKLRVGAGGTIDAFAWSPSPTAGLINGTPDTFLGRPIFTSSNVASMASDAKVLFYGDMSRFVMREVGGLQLERSADYLFGKNQLAVRGLSRIDSAFVDATAGVVLHQAVT